MRSITMFCAALAATSAMAGDLVAYEGTDVIRLSDQACASPAVLERLPEDVREEFRSASAVLQGQRYAACWRITPTAAFLMYEDGDQGLVPLRALKVPVDV